MKNLKFLVTQIFCVSAFIFVSSHVSAFAEALPWVTVEQNGQKQTEAIRQDKINARCDFSFFTRNDNNEKYEHETVSVCIKSAQAGDAESQYILGRAFHLGKGIKKDIEKALFWYRKAAEQGYVNAQHDLGLSYFYGQGVAKNLEKAVFWWQKQLNKDMRHHKTISVIFMKPGRELYAIWKRHLTGTEKVP